MDELTALIAEQQRDDKHYIRREWWLEATGAVSLDADGPVFGEYADMIGTQDGEIVFIIRGKAFVDYHGTLNGYNNHLCRCDRCRKANADNARSRYDSARRRRYWKARAA